MLPLLFFDSKYAFIMIQSIRIITYFSFVYDGVVFLWVGDVGSVGRLLFGLRSFLILLIFATTDTCTRGSPISVGHFVSSLVGGVALRRGVNRLGLPIANRVAANRTGDDGITGHVHTNRINKLFGLGNIRHVHSMRGRTIRRDHLNVPLLFNVSIVRKCRAIFPVPLKLSYA